MRNGLSTSEAGKLGGQASAPINTAKKQKRIEEYNKNPKLCKACSSIISYDKRYNDFCNNSCSATFNNQGIRRHGDALIDCLNCGNKTSNDKYCSSQCQKDFEWIIKKEEIKIGSNENVAVKTLKRYLIEDRGAKCEICNISEWMGQILPLVMDHIDGNPYNNIVSNLRLICNNCDALLPTFKGRNKGNGRFKRAERYKLEKELVGNIEGFKYKH